MTYEILRPPFSLKFREMSKADLLRYGEWFHQSMDGRLAGLTNAVKETPGFEMWHPTFEPDSLNKLGEWFCGEVGRRRRTPKELSELDLPPGFTPPEAEWELTDRTFSIAFDIGIYLGKTLIKAFPNLEWKQDFKDKRFVDYGQPVIVGLGKVPMNPVRIAATLAYGIASGRVSGNRLMEIFNNWARLVGS